MKFQNRRPNNKEGDPKRQNVNGRTDIADPFYKVIGYELMIQSSRVTTYEGRKKLSRSVRCIRTKNFPLLEIGTWEKERYNGGYVVTIVRCMRIENFPLREIGSCEKIRCNDSTL